MEGAAGAGNAGRGKDIATIERSQQEEAEALAASTEGEPAAVEGTVPETAAVEGVPEAAPAADTEAAKPDEEKSSEEEEEEEDEGKFTQLIVAMQTLLAINLKKM
jgi:hypothetical protein